MPTNAARLDHTTTSLADACTSASSVTPTAAQIAPPRVTRLAAIISTSGQPMMASGHH